MEKIKSVVLDDGKVYIDFKMLVDVLVEAVERSNTTIESTEWSTPEIAFAETAKVIGAIEIVNGIMGLYESIAASYDQ